MTHDIVCPCAPDSCELPCMNGYCWCECDLIAKAHRNTIYECIRTVEYIHDYKTDDDQERDILWNVICELRKLLVEE